MTDFTGTSGDDNQDGTNHGDVFDYSQGGQDRLSGLRGDDTFLMGAAFTPDDRIIGGSGFDTVVLDGDYSQDVYVLRTNTLRNIETVHLVANAARYQLFFNDGATDPGVALFVFADRDSAGGVWIDGTLMHENMLSVSGTDSDDLFIAGAQSDIFVPWEGSDSFDGRAGDDTVLYGDGLDAFDIINGGLGFDRMVVNGDYSSEVVLGASTILNFEMLDLDTTGDGFSYAFRFDDGNNGGLLTIDANTAERVSLDGSQESDGAFDMHGSFGDDALTGGGGNDIMDAAGGNDTLVGGAGDDTLRGAFGGDTMEGGEGRDDFRYLSGSESTGASHDMIIGFDARKDVFLMPFRVKEIDPAVTTGQLDSVTFDDDLVEAMDGGVLAVRHALLFTPDSGDQAGIVFVVADLNRMAGYQPGDDLVVALVDPSHLNTFDTSNFSLG